MNEKREYSKFQLKIIALFQEEIVTRLDSVASQIFSEDDVMAVVDECYEELFGAQIDIENGAVDFCRRPEGALEH